MNAGSRDGLAAAEEELRRNPPPELSIADHPASLAGLAEVMAQREQEGADAA